MSNYYIKAKALPEWHQYYANTDDDVDIDNIFASKSGLTNGGSAEDCYIDGETDFANKYYSITSTEAQSYPWIKTPNLYWSDSADQGVIVSSAPYFTYDFSRSKTITDSGYVNWDRDECDIYYKKHGSSTKEYFKCYTPFLYVFMIGGGGGGGGGHRQTFGQNYGGGGGGGGAMTSFVIDVSKLSNLSINLIIGSSGAGGAGSTGTASDGYDGGDTYANLPNNTYIYARGGAGGTGAKQGSGGSGGNGGTTETEGTLPDCVWLKGEGYGGNGGNGGKTSATGGEATSGSIGRVKLSPYGETPSYGATGGNSSAQNSNSAGGGGGGGSYGAGWGSTSMSPSDGAGGAGGGATGSNGAAAGAAGGKGKAIIYWSAL